MATTLTRPDEPGSPAAEEETRPRRLPRASKAAFVLGMLFTLLIFGSWLSSAIFDFEEEATVGREVFGNIPDELVLAFYAVLVVLVLWGGYHFSVRVQNWERGGPDRRATTTKNVGRRLRDFRAGVYMQTLMRDKGAGLMHSMIY